MGKSRQPYVRLSFTFWGRQMPPKLVGGLRQLEVSLSCDDGWAFSHASGGMHSKPRFQNSYIVMMQAARIHHSHPVYHTRILDN